MRLDSNIDSKSWNNTFLNIIELLLLFLFPVLITLNAKFGSNIDFRKVDFLSHEKVFIEFTLRDVFFNKAGAFTYFFRT